MKNLAFIFYFSGEYRLDFWIKKQSGKLGVLSDHMQWIRTLPLYKDLGEIFITHAGIIAKEGISDFDDNKKLDIKNKMERDKILPKLSKGRVNFLMF